MSMELMVKAMKIRVGNPLRKLVLIKLADNASDQGECWPSYQHIADQCEISKRSVMNHIAALCESGLVKKVTRKGEKGNSSNIYLLHLDGAGDSLGGSANNSLSGAANSLGSAGVAPGGSAGDSLGGSANNSLSGAANSLGSAGVAPGGSAGDSPRTSHSFEPVKEPVNEPIAVGASVDESVRVRSNRPEYSPEFEQAWLAYPKRAGGNSKSAAFKAWKARLNEGVNPETMLEGVKRYAGWVSAMGNSGTQFVKQAVTFFGPDRHFEESWEVPAVSAARREDPYFKASYDNVDYSQIPTGFRG
ncbi:helix-turn-helix domain-containing protein [Escherichia coli]|nr:helix-turn-helix domain-containing protein [Escherichia coli]NJZ19030.1 helix-turn-helix domain-containing protein [Escherichia coli]